LAFPLANHYQEELSQKFTEIDLLFQVDIKADCWRFIKLFGFHYEKNRAKVAIGRVPQYPVFIACLNPLKKLVEEKI